MKFKKLSSLLFAFVFAFAFLVAGCSNGSDDSNSAEEQSGTITLSAEATSATVGDVVSLSVSFSGWSENPTAVDVYVKESSDALKTGVAVSAGKITLDTSHFEAGTYNLYVASGSVKSNSIEVTLTKNALKAPAGLAVAASTETNTVKVTWTNNGAQRYWIYYNTSDDTATATCASTYKTSGTYGCEITLSASGTYYFWIKAADGYDSTDPASAFSDSVSYDFTYTSLSAPTGLAVAASTETNTVKVTWTNNGAQRYWIYYNTSDDTATATCASTYKTSGTYGCEITLSASGTYYFWIKAADGYDSTDKTSDFSDSVSYDFTYTSLSAPTGLAVAASTETNTVKVTWTNNGAQRYWIYYNTSDDTATATCASTYKTSGTYGCEITLSASGTYYFWIKAADGYDSTDKTSDFSSSISYNFIYSN